MALRRCVSAYFHRDEHQGAAHREAVDVAIDRLRTKVEDAVAVGCVRCRPDAYTQRRKSRQLFGPNCGREKSKNEPQRSRRPQRYPSPARGRLRPPFTSGSGGKAIKHAYGTRYSSDFPAAPGCEWRNAKRWLPGMNCGITPPWSPWSLQLGIGAGPG